MKILFVNRLFENVSGGIERMAIAMMNEMIHRGHSVELLSWDQKEAATYYPMDAKVIWHKLDMGNARQKAGFGLRLRRQLALRRLVQKSRPDVVIVFQHGPFLTMATALIGSGFPLIAAERSAPDRFEHIRAKKWKGAIFNSFRLADCITVQSEAFVSGYPTYLRDRIVAIPNPVQPAKEFANPAGGKGHTRQLLCIGRLSYPKNQHLLIQAFSMIADRVPEWNLKLVGDGENEKVLLDLIERKQMTSRITLVPPVHEISCLYQQSHLFCLPSEWEGFPNAVAEAMAHGLPIAGFSGCAGVRQLVLSGQNGLLAEGNGSADALADVLLPLMRDDDMRQRMGRKSVSLISTFAPEIIFDQWEKEFSRIARVA